MGFTHRLEAFSGGGQLKTDAPRLSVPGPPGRSLRCERGAERAGEQHPEELVPVERSPRSALGKPSSSDRVAAAGGAALGLRTAPAHACPSAVSDAGLVRGLWAADGLLPLRLPLLLLQLLLRQVQTQSTRRGRAGGLSVSRRPGRTNQERHGKRCVSEGLTVQKAP